MGWNDWKGVGGKFGGFWNIEFKSIGDVPWSQLWIWRGGKGAFSLVASLVLGLSSSITCACPLLTFFDDNSTTCALQSKDNGIVSMAELRSRSIVSGAMVRDFK